jgi:hypothetical protein
MSAHHALLYLGTSVAVVPELLQHQSIDVQHIIAPDWKIADTRYLSAVVQGTAFTGNKRHVVAVAHTLTIEAQNALLKVLEEPPAGVTIHLVVPGRDRLLPTVLSRLQAGAATNDQTVSAEWQEFQSSSVATRLEHIVAASKRDDRQWQRAILASAVARPELSPSIRLLLDTYRTLPGASRKMLLEEVALSLSSR